MTPRRRRLAAILAADVAGYSRLMERDEAGTLARVEAIRDDIVATPTSTREGRIFKTTGDGVLAEFASAVAAIEAAVAIQAALTKYEAVRAEAERIHLRIGISLGDVMVDGNDLYGNGVNIVARMESLAEPGGICISGNVHVHVAGALDVAFEDLGPQQVKNVEQPIHCYRVVKDGKAVPRAMISEEPSVVVLPFTNMSSAEGQEYFSDDITEDIITALSRIRQLFVVARNTAFTYKGQAVDVRAVARGTGRALCARRQRAPRRQPGPHHGPVDRRRQRRPPMGRTLRPEPRGHLHRAGRNHRERRRHIGAGDHQGGIRTPSPRPTGQPRYLAALSARPLSFSPHHRRRQAGHGASGSGDRQGRRLFASPRGPGPLPFAQRHTPAEPRLKRCLREAAGHFPQGRLARPRGCACPRRPRLRLRIRRRAAIDQIVPAGPVAESESGTCPLRPRHDPSEFGPDRRQHRTYRNRDPAQSARSLDDVMDLSLCGVAFLWESNPASEAHEKVRGGKDP